MNATTRGHVEVVRWLLATQSTGYSTSAIDGAACEGHLDIVKLLHVDQYKACTSRAMDGTAENGHLDVVLWLHEHRSEGCTFREMDNAAQNGHLDILKWLHEHRREGCTAMAMTQTASNGHMDVLQWLHETQNKGCTVNAAVLAAEGGHIEVLKWLHVNNVCVEWSPDVMDTASSLEVLHWLHLNRIEGCSSKALVNVAFKNNFESVLFLREHYRDVGCSPKVVECALKLGHIAVFQWLHENYPFEELCRSHRRHLRSQVLELSEVARKIYIRQRKDRDTVKKGAQRRRSKRGRD